MFIVYVTLSCIKIIQFIYWNKYLINFDFFNINYFSNSDKNRVPSYCDRIIWSGDGCEPIVYRSHPEFVCSDHKPVSAYFSVDVSSFYIHI